MLKISTEPTFTHPVTARVPVDGGFREDKFTATFRVLATDKMDEFNLVTTKGQREFLAAAIVRLDELEDDEKRSIPYSDEVRDQVIRIPYVRTALAKAYFDGVSGAALGNSNGPLARG